MINSKDKLAVMLDGTGGRREYIDWEDINPTEPKSGAPAMPVAAKGEVKFTNAGTDGDKITVNDVVYTLKDTLAKANDVKIGGSAAATAQSLAHAINGTGTSGSDYFANTKKPTDVEASLTSATITLTAKTKGVAAHAYSVAIVKAEASGITKKDFADGVDGTVAKAGTLRIDYTPADGATPEELHAYLAVADTTVSDGSEWKELAFVEDEGDAE